MQRAKHHAGFLQAHRRLDPQGAFDLCVLASVEIRRKGQMGLLWGVATEGDSGLQEVVPAGGD